MVFGRNGNILLLILGPIEVAGCRRKLLHVNLWLAVLGLSQVFVLTLLYLCVLVDLRRVDSVVFYLAMAVRT